MAKPDPHPATEALAAALTALDHPDGRVLRLVNLIGDTPPARRLRTDLATALLYTLEAEGFTVKRSKK